MFLGQEGGYHSLFKAGAGRLANGMAHFLLFRRWRDFIGSSKRLSRVRDGDEGFVGRNKREKYFLNEIDLPFRQTNDSFYKKGNLMGPGPSKTVFPCVRPH